MISSALCKVSKIKCIDWKSELSIQKTRRYNCMHTRGMYYRQADLEAPKTQLISEIRVQAGVNSYHKQGGQM